ncbi:MAG: hypothetical protein EU533_03710 [Promethearchaeota archaeon]|nr:MAG: hypothetical protein EU533_03710 [Candidatus Lokiarchaeota archaeon]
MDNEKKEKRLFTVKIVNLISGLLILGATFWILLDSGAAINFYVILIAVSLVIIGIARIMVGTSQEDLKKSARVWKIFSGLVALFVGLSVNIIQIRFPTVTVAWLILLSSLALLVVGLARFFRGLQAKQYPLWYRILILIAGCTSIVISILIGLPNLNLVAIITNPNTQVILLAITLMILALARISLIFLKKPEAVQK